MSDTLVIQTAYLGDLVLTTPLINALAGKYGPVDVVTTPHASPLLSGNPAVRSVIEFDKRGRDSGFSGLLRVAARLRSNGYRRVYLAHRSLRSALLALMSRVPNRIGFGDSVHGFLYTENQMASGNHEIDRYLQLMGGAEKKTTTLYPSGVDRDAARRTMGQAGIVVTEPYVVLAPGSAWPTKRWPYFRDLALELGANIQVVITGETHDRLIPQVSDTAHTVADLCGLVSLTETVSVISAATIVVANDSAPMHFSDAVGTPVVGIFGPTSSTTGFGPRGKFDRTIEIELTCRPCSSHGSLRCPLVNHRCMIELDTRRVAAAVTGILESIRQGTY